MKTWLVIFFVMRWVLLASDAVPVSQRELVARYVEYSGKHVIVSGEVVSEMTLMYLSSATGSPEAREGMLVVLSEETTKKPDALAKRFTKDLKKSGRVTAELEGRFEGAADRRWGHQACCRFRFQVERVLSLK